MDETLERLLRCLDIDQSDYDEESTIGSFYDEVELDEVKQRIGDEFDVNVDSMDLDTTIYEMAEGLKAHIESQG